ncbi:hypothetical protein RPB_0766 [Rhodopseudomonas palustris HaA2]|uniref:Uncharacterized protein n=1 Tax=Rhodopseudomonas palustris (strain HaA2) TaxID=316058 RepID=Q2J233_RHOP2|nr:hypothetical protein [Rhodopseudomonas palustris]ABD05477.1 hypothetical protein RPB_0766 [Rhodopseudomonas palustris HaA2]
MTDRDKDDELFVRLDRLVTAARILRGAERRLILSLESDIRRVRAGLSGRCEELAHELRTLNTRSRAASAYGRTASMGRGAPQRN